MEYIEAFEEFDEDEVCNKCSAKYRYSTVKGYCQDCVDEAQAKKDTSSKLAVIALLLVIILFAIASV